MQGHRIMSGSLPNSSDGNEDYVVQQENELEALASIFGDDFRDIRTEHPWKVMQSNDVKSSEQIDGAGGKSSWLHLSEP